MRTRSLISIIRRYGVNSKRLSPRYKIKYEQAIKAIKQYESSELKIADVIDNELYPTKSISCKCQIPGCGHRIRYEYVLENKQTKERLVAGSTCVWPTLGFSEIQKKEFNSYEKVIKEHNDMILWSKDNPDIIDKLNTLKREGFMKYRPFWEEIEFSRLCKEDEEYIRNTDVDALIQQRDEQKKRREEMLKKAKEERERINKEYDKIIEHLEELVIANPTDTFYHSLLAQHRRGKRLTSRQIRCIKVNANKKWYNDVVRGTESDIMDSVDTIMNPFIRKSGIVLTDDNRAEYIIRINDLISEESNKVKWAWKLFRVKHELVY